jgi:hypothetical protein
MLHQQVTLQETERPRLAALQVRRCRMPHQQVACSPEMDCSPGNQRRLSDSLPPESSLAEYQQLLATD